MSAMISTLERRMDTLREFTRIPDDQLSPLLLAARQGDCEKMGVLLGQMESLDQLPVQDALAIAAMMGHEQVVDLMVQRGAMPNPPRKFDVFMDSWQVRLTAMGHAIEKRHSGVVDVLLKHGAKIEDTARKQGIDGSALDLFFSQHKSAGNNPAFLKILLNAGAVVHSLTSSTIFNIAVYGNSEELELLVDAGLDPKSVHLQESRPELKGKDAVFYSPEVNLLDLTVMQAERANIFAEDLDSIKKVSLLIKKGADPQARNCFCDKNYLHHASNPSLIQLFGESGVDVRAKALLGKFWKIQISPIEYAHTDEAVNLLCSFGEERENSPFLKETQAHSNALSRIGFKQIDEKGEIPFIKAYEQHDVAAFVALLGEGVDVNQRRETGAHWTSLHHLFSEISSGSVSKEYDYISIASKNLEHRLINMLIQHGALPLKDAIGRTPLMCLSFHPFNTAYTRQITEIYIDFEAAYYGLNKEEYREKFFKLRSGGYVSHETLLGSHTVPIKSVFDNFWASFTTHEPFNPGETHNPTADWNRMRDMLEGK